MNAVSVKKIWTTILLLISAFPLWPKAVESFLMILFFILSMSFFFINKKEKLKNKNIKDVFILSSLFIIYGLSSIYSNNNSESLKFLVLSSPILMFPLCFGFFCSNEISTKERTKIKIIYVCSLLLSLVITHIYLEFKMDGNISNWDYRNLFENYTKVHGTYFSLWISFGILILVNELFAIKRSSIFISLSLIILAYFFYWQFTIGARLPLFITLVLCTFFLVKKTNKKYKLLFIITLATIVVSFIYLKFDSIKNKIKFGMPEGKYELKHKEMTNEEIRTGIYYCSASLIKNSLLFGYGVGDVNDELNNCYKQKIKSDVYQLFHYNSHNQYLQVFLSAGIVGFVFFIFTILSIFKKALINKDKLFLMLNILIFICFITENVLSRHDGVIFYGYFTSLFYFKTNKC
ncbi:O-antigen ligase family protein [Polaribacter sp.]|uniref:O-antigen ligase family protein n=1 Tax=Polaribacter sp. TaxID=1920175 RepID=UPI003EF7C3A1